MLPRKQVNNAFRSKNSKGNKNNKEDKDDAKMMVWCLCYLRNQEHTL